MGMSFGYGTVFDEKEIITDNVNQLKEYALTDWSEPGNITLEVSRKILESAM